MADTFEGISEAIANQPRAFAQGDFEFLLKRLPQPIFEAFAKIAEGEGVDAIMKKLTQAEAFRRKRLRTGLRGSLGRRLGPRSGAIDTLIANQVTAPSFGRLSELQGGLLQRGQEFGLSGIQDMLRFFQDQIGVNEELRRSRQGPGVLDFVGPALQVGGAIFGGPAGAAAGGAVGSSLGLGNEDDFRRNRRPL